jgi:hypothetical protein
MPQTLITKHRGEVTFRKTWVDAGGRHIGALVGGGYAHLSGILVEKKRDLLDLIPSGPELVAACNWWDNKDIELEPSARHVVFGPKGFVWDDGSPIVSAQSLVENFPRGKDLDMMLEWFHDQKQQKLAASENEDADYDKAVTAAQTTLAVKKTVNALNKKSPGRPKKA